ncbi:hypothetical protein CRENBAI_013898 [Crenichthys baileyi]|uniref:Synaptotagmin-7 n=1 Tax=Crenichthys baileyi TaxID=28760 RepID=A0AAV9SE66_9TELE
MTDTTLRPNEKHEAIPQGAPHQQGEPLGTSAKTIGQWMKVETSTPQSRVGTHSHGLQHVVGDRSLTVISANWPSGGAEYLAFLASLSEVLESAPFGDSIILLEPVLTELHQGNKNELLWYLSSLVKSSRVHQEGSTRVPCFELAQNYRASEGKLVVLALAIGVAEQDDFANIPDLQETAQAAPPANQEPPPEKRGNKPANSPKGHNHDADGHSSVTDLANSLTGDMVMLSPGSEDDDGEGPVSEKLGRIQFSIGYSFQNTTLTVKVLKGQDLPAKDFSGTSDPFVKIYLLPDKKHKLETKVKRKNLNPHWNETFLFEGFPYEKVRERTLYLQVLDYDRFSRNDPIGEVSIPLNKVELGQLKTFWKELKPCSDGSGRRGDLLVSLCYNPTANTITVNIIKARHLKAMDIGGTSDPYVKVWLMHKDKRVEKKKTPVIKRCLNPVFNESFPFDVPAHVLRETTIIITVMDKDRLSRNDVIGKIYLSWKSGPAEVKHWKDMLARPRTNVAQWHALKA